MTCVERIIGQYNAQTYDNKELVIFNTDVKYPIRLLNQYESIFVINNDLDYVYGQPYTNRGDILRDAIKWAAGDYFMLADDDDIYLPWHIQQAVEGIQEVGTDAWKPEKSFFAVSGEIKLVQNRLEASVIVKMDRIREIGFRSDQTGLEGLSWYTKLRDEGQLNEHNKKYLPSYCFNWSDPSWMAGHKQSGDINNPRNFENHKEASIDAAQYLVGEYTIEQLKEVYKPYMEWIESHPDQINQKYYNRYIQYL